MKGEKLSELLTDIDPDLVADAMPPDWKRGKVGKVRRPKKERRWLHTLGDIMDSGWAAAILSVVVSVGVLTAIVWAGRQAAMEPGTGDGGTNRPGGQVGAQIDGNTDDAGNRGEARPDLPLDDVESNGHYDTETDITIGIPDGIPTMDAPVAMHMNGTLYTDNTIGLYDGYLVSEWLEYHDPADGNSYDATGDGAASCLPDIAEGLIAKGYALASACRSLTFTTYYAHMTVTSIRAYNFEYGSAAHFRGNTLDRTDLDELRTNCPGGVFLVIEVETNDLNDKFTSQKIEEYPVYLYFPQLNGAPLFDPLPVEGYPTNGVLFERDAVEKILYSEIDPDNRGDMEGFVESYAPGVTPENAALMIKLMRAVGVAPVCRADASGLMLDNAQYDLGSETVKYRFFDEDGDSYEFYLYANASHANDCMATLTLLEQSFMAFYETHALAVNQTDSRICHMWLDMKGVLAYVRIKSYDTDMSLVHPAAWLSGFTIWWSDSSVPGGDYHPPETNPEPEPETLPPIIDEPMSTVEVCVKYDSKQEARHELNNPRILSCGVGDGRIPVLMEESILGYPRQLVEESPVYVVPADCIDLTIDITEQSVNRQSELSYGRIFALSNGEPTLVGEFVGEKLYLRFLREEAHTTYYIVMEVKDTQNMPEQDQHVTWLYEYHFCLEIE